MERRIHLVVRVLAVYQLVRIALWKDRTAIINYGKYDVYDFIIVGAGSAGCVVASRLTESSNVSVLLIEAGGVDNHPDIHVPLAYEKLQQTAIDWQYVTIPQRLSSQGLRKQQSNWPRGKVLGGSSSINLMMYIRGHQEDYNRWENIYGAKEWNWDQVEGYFHKAENWYGPDIHAGSYGSGGPLDVGYVNYHTPSLKWFLKASEELGYKYKDPNSDFPIGVSRPPTTTKNGERWSTASAYLHPVRYRDNLYLLLNSRVTELEMDGTKAVGVHLINEKTQKERYIRARKEIILSAGTVGSPEILLRSGIGPADHLQDVGIDIVKDLPVGKNLQDHIMAPLSFLLPEVPETSGLTYTHEYHETSLNILKFLLFGNGPLSGMAVEGNIFHKSQFAKDDRQDLQLLYIGGSCIGKTVDNFNYIPLLAKYYCGEHTDKEFNGVSGFFMVAILLHPLSKGDIKLHKNSRAPILISPNYLEQSQDVETLLEGIHTLLDLVNTSEFSKLAIKRPYLGLKSPYKMESDDFWRWYIRNAGVTVYHPVGTCKMGGDNDNSVVVDSRLRVRGVANLRVVDASIMPETPSGNTNAPVIMIGEKASDMIKEDHNIENDNIDDQ